MKFKTNYVDLEKDSDMMLADTICCVLSHNLISMRIEDLRSTNALNALTNKDFNTTDKLFNLEQSLLSDSINEAIEIYLEVAQMFIQTPLNYTLSFCEYNINPETKITNYLTIYKNGTPLFVIYQKNIDGCGTVDALINLHDIQERFEDFCVTDYDAAIILGGTTSSNVQKCIHAILRFNILFRNISDIDNVLSLFTRQNFKESCKWLICDYEKLKPEWHKYINERNYNISEESFKEAYNLIITVLRDYLH